jgi:hypothetical protein
MVTWRATHEDVAFRLLKLETLSKNANDYFDDTHTASLLVKQLDAAADIIRSLQEQLDEQMLANSQLRAENVALHQKQPVDPASSQAAEGEISHDPGLKEGCGDRTHGQAQLQPEPRSAIECMDELYHAQARFVPVEQFAAAVERIDRLEKIISSIQNWEPSTVAANPLEREQDIVAKFLALRTKPERVAGLAAAFSLCKILHEVDFDTLSKLRPDMAVNSEAEKRFPPPWRTQPPYPDEPADEARASDNLPQDDSMQTSDLNAYVRDEPQSSAVATSIPNAGVSSRTDDFSPFQQSSALATAGDVTAPSTPLSATSSDRRPVSGQLLLLNRKNCFRCRTISTCLAVYLCNHYICHDCCLQLRHKHRYKACPRCKKYSDFAILTDTFGKYDSLRKDASVYGDEVLSKQLDIRSTQPFIHHRALQTVDFMCVEMTCMAKCRTEQDLRMHAS